MRRLVVLLGVMMILVAGSVRPLTAQEMQPDPSFSNQVLATYGLPEIEITQLEDGYNAPREVEAGRYLIALVSDPELSAYLNLVQAPAGLSPADAEEQLLSAAREDVPVEGWTYGGGTYAFGGDTSWVVLDLPPGEWAWGLTSQPNVDQAEETVHLMPLTVTAGAAAATPVAVEIEPAADVALTEFVFTGLEGTTLPAGPQVWRFTNQGAQAHHMVLFRTPTLIAQEDVTSMVDAFMSATPTPPPSWWIESVWVGYAAIMSPGQSMVTEFDLAPGSYAALCFIADPETGMPHLMEGMAQSFTVA
ncbi:MAG: hypothetical protein H0W59_01340 [Chloroflexia bacterium]|nr:hypothetical protein [Chloroflexia bacterium]